MKSFLAMAAVPVLSVILGTQLVAQTIIRITDAPFTASMSHTRDGGKPYVSAYLARASNGSTYVAAMDSEGRKMHITIEDVPNNRTIQLTPQPPSYTYTLTPAPGGKFRTDTIDRFRELLQGLQNEAAKQPDWIDGYGARHHPIVPGVRKQDGMTLFGRLDHLTYADGKKVEEEYWRSDLGITLIDKVNLDSPTEGKGDHVSTVTDLHLVEPDPKLFEISAEYFPENDPLFNAKSVFIDNQTGEEEVTDGAMAILKDWKRMAVVTSREKADLIAVFSKTTRYDLGPAVSTVEMNIYQPDSEHPIFTSRPVLRPDAAIIETTREDQRITRQCVLDLENRLDNTRIGLITLSPPIK
jgi:hypothetical protein